jgi:glycosyltransferase involved in cell wall biosynthesis
MKKLLDIVPYNYLPYFSGGQKSIAQFLEYFGQEADLTVAGVDDNDFSLVKSYKALPLLKNRSTRYVDLTLIGKITSLVKKQGYDAVIWEHPYYAWLAWIIRKRTGVKTVFHTHNIEWLRFQSNGKWWWPILRMYERWAFRFADLVFFINEEEKNWAIKAWKLDKAKCTEITFGIESRENPPDRDQCRRTVAARHHIKENEKIFLFNGLLDYKPNREALMLILDQINPVLFETPLPYKIIICGKRLPPELNELAAYAGKNIIYAGFVDDIDLYFKAADIFLNPVQTGGGIKTKMVEAIGLGTTVVATQSGAAGIHKETCGDKLIVVEDNDWAAFTEAVIRHADKTIATPVSYYQTYYWGNIAKKAIVMLSH